MAEPECLADNPRIGPAGRLFTAVDVRGVRLVAWNIQKKTPEARGGKVRPRDVALATLPPALWAIAYTIAKPAMQNFPPLFLMSIIYGTTAVALFRPDGKRQTPLWVIIIGSTLRGSLQSGLIFCGIALVPATTAHLRRPRNSAPEVHPDRRLLRRSGQNLGERNFRG